MKKWKRELRLWNIFLSNRLFITKRKILSTFGNTSKYSARWLKFLSALLLGGVFYGYYFLPGIPSWVMMAGLTFLFYLLLTLGEKVFGKLRRPLRQLPSGLFIAILALSYGLYTWFDDSGSKGFSEDWELYLAVVFIVLVQWLFSKAFGAIFINGKRNQFSGILFLVTLGINVALFSFFFFDGPTSRGKEEILSYVKEPKDVIEAGSPRYQVEVLDYGMGDEALGSRTVSLYPYVSYSGFKKKIRDYVSGSHLGEAPIAGRLYLPNRKNAPLLIFAHGNHRMTEANHLGYDYLGKFLASRGIAMASVDENILNGFLIWGLGGENDARAALLLENVKWLLEENNTEDSPLYGKFDPKKMALGGHSRGGEAAAVAAYFQKLHRNPDRGSLKLDYDFGIRTVLAVSPTYGQYKPGGHDIKLKGVNYLVLHGSHDGDVNTFLGEQQYDRVTPEDSFKVAVYVGFANHGQFNTRWGKNDTEHPGALLYHKGDLMEDKEQQEILCRLAWHFLESSFTGKGGKEFAGPIDRLTGVPGLYYRRYSDDGFSVINNYEEDGDIETSTVPGGRNEGRGLGTWGEEEVEYSIGSRNRNNHGLAIKTSSSKGTYVTTFEKPREFGDVALDVMNRSEEDPLAFSVELRDSKGETARVSTEKGEVLYPAIPVGILKIQHLTGRLEYKSQFQTVTLPLEEFKKDNPSFDEKSVTEVKFLFNLSKDGNIIIDEVGTVPAERQ